MSSAFSILELGCVTRTATLALALASVLLAPPVGAQPTEEPRALQIDLEPWTGDFDQMLERRKIRILLPYSRTLYYNDKGHERGLAAELVRDFERYINKKHAKKLGKRPVTVYIIPVTRDKLIADITRGLGDIAAGNITETPERLKLVDFVAPKDRKPIRELVVTDLKSAAVASVDDLSGKHFHVRKASSYFGSLTALNKRFKKERKAKIKITVVPDALEDEDLLEMLNAGLVEFLVVDDWKAKAWAQLLPEIRVTDIALAEGSYTGWAIRKRSPKLAEEINDFYVNSTKVQGVIDYRAAKFHKRIKQITNNTATAEWKRFEQILDLFEKYGAKYNFDPLMLAAQGYQESRLKQETRSPVGAIGVMQIMPATGAELKVGDITILEPNIHAGAKYMDQLMTTYFADANLSEDERPLFAFSSYNAGPGRIASLRKEAEKRGLDPNRWFNNVELVAAEKVGMETTTYVRNIYKYYTAYKLQLEIQEEQRKAREKLAPAEK